MASCDMDSSFSFFSFFSSPRTFFFFFLVKKKDYRYTFPPSSSWPSCAGFRQIYFSKHLWTLGESRSLFAKGAFCSERFWIMPYQAAMILTRALEEQGGGGVGWGGGLTLCMTTLCCSYTPPPLPLPCPVSVSPSLPFEVSADYTFFGTNLKSLKFL